MNRRNPWSLADAIRRVSETKPQHVPPPPESKPAMPLLFISYSNKDKEIAARVAKIVGEKAKTFLAHEQIGVSESWRDEILKNLRSCTAIICIVTENFSESEWTSQEAGFVYGKDRKVISLKFDDAKLPGFLESLQAIPTSLTHTPR